ncbi:alpha-glucosidase [Lacticaseibacillus porcinae]|uniref:alpha-glucosidase n=1 Tax=Lacticaseibacillus porcinae TaxID=1123687 RepID=UPI000F77E707|nr:alpha-glucosidase [Lacticaseibacillus porcinae]
MAHWYDQAIIYQIYPKSFQDSNGDGIGDLNGIKQRIPYLKALGINTVWLNPVFASPQVDNGYDVANYYTIDQSLGTMADMEALIQALHDADMHLLLDIALNHTSDQHPWFQDATSSVNSIYRDYYIFAGHDGKKPNNWGSFFGGSVWSPDPTGSGASYFHLFDTHMPDLNWANPELRHAMEDVCDFWLAKGIDGLRADAFIHIAKAPLNQNYPTATGDDEAVVAESFFANLPQVKTWLQPFVTHLKTDYPNMFLLGEAASASVELGTRYTDHLMDAVITFRYFTADATQTDPALPQAYQPLPMDWLAFKQQQVIWQQTLPSAPILYWGNHDMARVYGRVAHSELAAKSLALLMYLQRGLPIIYYGEELGMQNLTFETATDFDDQTVDTFMQAAHKQGLTADEALAMVNATHKLPARGPMLWDTSAHAGFSTQTPWLEGHSHATDTVSVQRQAPDSMLHFYQQVLALKQLPLFQQGDYLQLTTDDQSYVYQRQLDAQTAIVAVAIGTQKTTLTLPASDFEVALACGDYQLDGDRLTLMPEAGVVLRKGGIHET